MLLAVIYTSYVACVKGVDFVSKPETVSDM